VRCATPIYGSAGKITNCQIGVFASYVSCHGYAFIDRALYLPKSWTGEPGRLKAAYVPDGVGFATKPQLAVRMIERAIAATVPFRWVAADTVYGVGEIEQELRRVGKGYVLAVDAAHVFRSWGKSRVVSGTAAVIAKTLKVRTGVDCRRAREPKDQDGTTGAISNWPISKPQNSTRQTTGCGRAAC